MHHAKAFAEASKESNRRKSILRSLKKNIDPETTLCREVKLRVGVSRENRNV